MEEPYKLPDGWQWFRGNEIFESMTVKHPSGEFFDYIDIDSIDNKKQVIKEPKHLNSNKAPSRASRELKYGDTVFSMVRPYLKNIAFIDKKYSTCIASTGFYVCRPIKNIVDAHYLYWLMTSPYVINGLTHFMKGDNSPSIRKKDIENFSFPIPELATQQKIADFIDREFARLDESKDKITSALDSAAARKQAILHKAFTGELTAKWREENGHNINEWKQIKLGDVTKVMSGGTPSTKHPEYYKNGNISWISPSDLSNYSGMYISSGKKNITKAGLENSSTHLLPKNTVCLSSRAPIGYVVIARNELCTNQGFKSFLPSKDIYPEFLYWYLKGNTKMLESLASGTTFLELSKKRASQIIMPLPFVEEQKEIAKVLNIFNNKNQALTEKLETTLTQIDTLKKAILSKVFRGELIRE